jgi:hypothetical protein
MRDELLFVLNKISKINDKPCTLDSLQNIKQDEIFEETNYNILDIFRYRSIRVQMFTCSFLYFSLMTIYDGVTYALQDLGVNVELNGLVIFTIETISYLIAGFYADRL